MSEVGVLVTNGGRDNSGRPIPPRTNYDDIFQNIQGNTNKIPGIASDITDIGGDTDKLLQQGYGLGKYLTNVGTDTDSLLKGQTGIAGQLTDQDTYLRNTVNPNILGLYGQTASLGKGQTGLSDKIGVLGTDISGQTTALQKYISDQIENVTDAQGVQDTNLDKILDNVGKEGTLATQLGTRANTLDKSIEDLQKTGDTAATSLSDLIGGQTKLKGNIGGLATDFGTFNEQYTNDQADAKTFRTTARDSLLGGQQQIQKAMGGNLGQRIDQVARNVDRQRTDQQQDFASVARLMSRNVPAREGSNDMVERGEFREALDKARFALQNNRFKDQNTANTYSALVNSFDADGKLLRSVRDGDNTIARSFEGENLMVDAVNSAGQDIGGISLNVNDLLNNLSGNIAQQQQQQQGIGAPQV